MTMQRFIPTAEVKRLTRGSYEHRVSQLGAKIEESSDIIFGADEAVHVLGTFPGYVLVASESGKCARVQYEETGVGTVQIVKVEEIEIPTYSSESVDSFLRSEADEVVKLFEKGDLCSGTKRLRGLVLHAEGWPSPKNEEQTVSTLLATISRKRPWTRLYEARKDQILRGLWKTLKQIEEARLRPQFRKLYDGSVRSGDLERYRSLVQDRFQMLHSRLVEVATVVEQARAGLQTTAPRVEELGEGEALTTFAAFSEDLLEDINRIDTIAIKSSKQVRRVDSLGQLHDELVERLSMMEVASHFVLQLSSRLGGAHQEEHR